MHAVANNCSSIKKKTLKYTRVIKLQICLKLNLHSTYAVPRSPHERVIFLPKIIKMAQSIQDLFITSQ